MRKTNKIIKRNSTVILVMTFLLLSLFQFSYFQNQISQLQHESGVVVKDAVIDPSTILVSTWNDKYGQYETDPVTWHSPPISIIGQGSMVELASWIIFTDGTNYYVKSGWRGELAYSSSNPATAINWATTKAPNQVIFACNGTYSLSSQITLTQANTTFIAQGPATKFITTGSTSAISVTADKCTIRDLYIQQSKLDAFYPAIYVINSNNVTIDSVTISNANHDGIYALKSNHLKVLNSLITTSYRHGISIKNSLFAEFAFNTVEGCNTPPDVYSTAINIYNCSDYADVHDNEISNCYDSFGLQGSNHCNFHNNRAQGCTHNGFDCGNEADPYWDCNYNTIESNILIGQSSALASFGIYFFTRHEMTGNIIRGNTISNFPHDGIGIDGTTGHTANELVIEDNTLISNGKYPDPWYNSIHLKFSNDSTIINNKCKNEGVYGISIESNCFDTIVAYNQLLDKGILDNGVNTQILYYGTSAVETYSWIISTNGTNYYYAKSGLNGTIKYSGTNASTIINYALGDLTSGRTWEETVYLKGNFSTSGTILLPDDCVLLLDGNITMANGKNRDIIANRDSGGNEHVAIIGVSSSATLNGNRDNNPTSGRGIYFKCKVGGTGYPTTITIENLHIVNCQDEASYISASGSGTSVLHNVFEDTCGSGHRSDLSDSIISDCFFTNMQGWPSNPNDYSTDYDLCLTRGGTHVHDIYCGGGAYGIVMIGSKGNLFENILVDTIQYTGLVLKDSGGNYCTDNQFTNIRFSGIGLNANNSFDAISLQGHSARNRFDNLVIAGQDSSHMIRYAINETALVDYTYVSDATINMTYIGTAPILKSGTHDILDNVNTLGWTNKVFGSIEPLTYAWLIYNDTAGYSYLKNANGTICLRSTNASYVFQTAINDLNNKGHWGIVYFKGFFTLTNTITVYAGIGLVGEGPLSFSNTAGPYRGTSVLHVGSSFATNVINVSVGFAGYSNFALLRDFTIIGGGAASPTTQNGVYVRSGVYDFELRFVNIFYCGGNGFVSYSSDSKNWIDGCYIENNDQSGLYLRYGYNFITNCYIYGNTLFGIDAVSAPSAYVSHSKFWNNLGGAVEYWGGGGYILSECSLASNGGTSAPAILIKYPSGTYQIQIIGNEIVDTRAAGSAANYLIKLDSSTNVPPIMITDNYFSTPNTVLYIADSTKYKPPTLQIKDNIGYSYPYEDITTTNWIIYTDGTNYYAESWNGTVKYSGTDAYTVINNVKNALTNGGKISLNGSFTLNDELIFDGGDYANKEWIIEGMGGSTTITQSTAGKNAIIIRNLSRVTIRDLKIAVGSSAKSGILLDDQGGSSVYSMDMGTIENVIISGGGSYPLLYIINPQNCLFSHIKLLSTSANAVPLKVRNTAADLNTGNCEFLSIVCSATGSNGAEFDSTTSKILNLLDFNDFELAQSGVVGTTKGIYIGNNTMYNQFSSIDVEGFYVSINLTGASGKMPYANYFDGNYLSSSTYGIYCSYYTQGNHFEHLRLALATTSIYDQASIFGLPNIYEHLYLVSGTIIITGNSKYLAYPASGTATVLASQYSVVVTHGLSFTPSIDDILLTPNSSMAGISYYISAANSTTFTITINRGINGSNMVKGITPTFSLFNTTPTNPTYMTDGDYSTTSGEGISTCTAAGDWGYIIFDMGVAYPVAVMEWGDVHRSSGDGTLSQRIEYSNDGSTFQGGVTQFSTATGDIYRAMAPVFFYARYFRIAVQCAATTSGTYHAKYTEVIAINQSINLGAIVFSWQVRRAS